MNTYILTHTPKRNLRTAYSISVRIVQAKSKSDAVKAIPADWTDNGNAFTLPVVQVLELEKDYRL